MSTTKTSYISFFFAFFIILLNETKIKNWFDIKLVCPKITRKHQRSGVSINNHLEVPLCADSVANLAQTI